MNQDWPHQTQGVNDTLAAIEAGKRLIALTSPTGGGKTRMAQRLIERWKDDGLRTAVYTNRKLLIEQLSRVFDQAGLDHGIRAAGHVITLGHALQICSTQTEHARKRRWDRFPAQRVIADEAHLQTGPAARELFMAHHQDGAAIVGLTATPFGMGMYEQLIVAGTNSQLREYGALVKAIHYGPDEPDLTILKGLRQGQDLTKKQHQRVIKPPILWGRILPWLKTLNPGLKPTILFAPGVPESLWFAEQLTKAGIPAAHIDGDEVWVNGRSYKSDEAARRDVLEQSRCGAIRALCNRFVLREGLDLPWLSHAIFACVFGSLQSYLQSGGRLLRASPGKDICTLQDHGGNWHRHGSLNVDREWHLDYTPEMVTALRIDRLCNREEIEPFRCPNCACIVVQGKCPGCGREVERHLRSRPVLMADGTLKEMHGDIYRPRRVTQRPDAASIWERMYYRAKNSEMTFGQAAGLFAKENNWQWPPRNLPLMPTDPLDWYRRVKDVPRERLIPKPSTVASMPNDDLALPLFSQ